MMLLYQIFVQQYTLVYEKFVFVELTTTFVLDWNKFDKLVGGLKSNLAKFFYMGSIYSSVYVMILFFSEIKYVGLSSERDGCWILATRNLVCFLLCSETSWSFFNEIFRECFDIMDSYLVRCKKLLTFTLEENEMSIMIRLAVVLL